MEAPQPQPPSRSEPDDDMSQYDMPIPDGRHVMWEDQQQQYAQPSPQNGGVVDGSVAVGVIAGGVIAGGSSIAMAKLAQMPTWAWLLIAVAALIFGFGIGYVMKGRARV
jgi:hypothetical protein